MKNWIDCTLGDLFEFEYGKGLTKKDRDDDGSYPVYGSNGIVGYHSSYLIEGPSIIVGRKGAVGEVHFELGNLWPIDTTYFIHVSPSLDFKFSYYLLKSLILGRLDKSTAIPGLNRNDAYDTQIRLFPLPEQRAIVAKIEQLFSELDNGIANLKTALEQLKVYRQAVLKVAFEGELTKAWRANQKDLPTAEELLEHIRVERERASKTLRKKLKDLPPLKESIKDIPTGWNSLTIDWFLSYDRKGMTTGPFGTLLKKSDHSTTGIPVLGIENIGEGVFKMPNKIFVTHDKAKELSSFQADLGDIIISRSGTVGEICAITKDIGKALISTNLIRISLNRSLIDSSYFVYLFQGGAVRDQVRKLCAGSTRDFLNQTILSSITFPVPSLPEQNQIVQEIESRLSVCDKVEETIKDSLEKAEALRQSILKKALEGKLLTEQELEACRQQPDWEPAEKLLERIKKEGGKAARKSKKAETTEVL